MGRSALTWWVVRAGAASAIGVHWRAVAHSARWWARLHWARRQASTGDDTLLGAVQTNAKGLRKSQSGRPGIDRELLTHPSSYSCSIRTSWPAFRSISSSSVAPKSSCTRCTAVLAGPPAAAMALAPADGTGPAPGVSGVSLNSVPEGLGGPSGAASVRSSFLGPPLRIEVLRARAAPPAAPAAAAPKPAVAGLAKGFELGALPFVGLGGMGLLCMLRSSEMGEGTRSAELPNGFAE